MLERADTKGDGTPRKQRKKVRDNDHEKGGGEKKRF